MNEEIIDPYPIWREAWRKQYIESMDRCILRILTEDKDEK